VMTADATCGENAERQVRMFSQRVQWTPLLLVVSVFACENTHSLALGLEIISYVIKKKIIYYIIEPMISLNDAIEVIHGNS